MRSLLFILPLLFLFSCHTTSEQKQEQEIAKDTIKKVAVDTPQTKDCAVLYKNARAMDSIILKQNELDLGLANKAVRAFTDFAFYCESDSLSPIFLVKTAQISIAINNANQAKLVLDRCLSNYPKFKNKPAAMFLLAQLYDEQNLLNDEDEAYKIYQKLIYEFPKSEWAANAKAAVKLLGKSDQEIINEFNKK